MNPSDSTGATMEAGGQPYAGSVLGERSINGSNYKATSTVVDTERPFAHERVHAISFIVPNCILVIAGADYNRPFFSRVRVQQLQRPSHTNKTAYVLSAGDDCLAQRAPAVGPPGRGAGGTHPTIISRGRPSNQGRKPTQSRMHGISNTYSERGERER